ncbi:MAG: prepilin-type N-terminal cleavage/methylation domain-containing protein [Candidatus Omnitrophota bacterium]
MLIKKVNKFMLNKTPIEKKRFLSGFTLMEVVVSLIILAAVFGGLTATFVGVKRYVSRASRRLVAVNLGKQVLNSLYRHVRADTWDTGALTLGTHTSTAADTQVPDSITLENFTYGVAGGANSNNYVVTAVAGRQYREVTVNIRYPVN